MGNCKLWMNGKKKVAYRYAFVLLLIFMVNGCSGFEKNGKPISPAQSFYLTEPQVQDFKEKAAAGDGEAAFRLYRFYDFYKSDNRQGFYWLEKAAQNSHVVAQYNLGTRYIYRPEKRDIVKAEYWLKKAAANGHAEAKRELNDLRKGQL